MSVFIYESPSHSVQAAQQRFERILRPMLDKVLTEDADKWITIGKDNNLRIAGVPIGDWRFISEFKFDERMNLHYSYKNVRREIFFGMFGFLPCYDILAIFEHGKKGEHKTVYSKVRGGVCTTPSN